MLRINRYFSLAFIALLMSPARCVLHAFAQTSSPDVISFSALLEMLSNQPDYRADWTAFIDEPAFGIKLTYRIKIARKHGMSRREIYPLENETRLKNKADKNYKIIMIDQAGQPPVALDPQAKTYTETPGVFNASFDVESFIKSKTKELSGIKLENVGIENIAGHQATKIRMTFEGERGEIFLYFAKDLKNLFLGINPGKPGEGSLTVSNISFDVPDDLFQIPQGYKKVDFKSFQATLKQKSPAPRSQRNAGALDVDPVGVPGRVPGDEDTRVTITPPIVAPRPAAATNASSRPVLLNLPSPNYTEKARKNKIQGIIPLKVLIGADGNVKKVVLLGGLPDGLDEQAVKTAYQLRFKPAMKDGKPVPYWMKVNIEFKLDGK